MVAGSVMVGAVLTNRSPVGITSVVPVARLTEEVGVIVVPASSEFTEIGPLLAALRSAPGGVSVAGGSAGGSDHITLGLMLKALGRSAREASYVAFAGGGPAQAAILGAQVKAGISGWSEFSEQIAAGRMRALATTGATRTAPNVPTLKESGCDVVTSNWRGVFAAPGSSRRHARPWWTSSPPCMPCRPGRRCCRRAAGMTPSWWAEAFEAFLRADIAATEAVLKDIGLA